MLFRSAILAAGLDEGVVHAHAGHAVLQVDDGLFVLPGRETMAKILAVDDEPAILEMIESILNKDGHLVTKMCIRDRRYSLYWCSSFPDLVVMRQMF